MKHGICSFLVIDADMCHRERMVFPLWRSMFSLNLMLSKEDRRALLLRLFDDDTSVSQLQQVKGNGEDKATPTLSGEEEGRKIPKAPVDKSDLETSTVEPDIARAEIMQDIQPPVGRTEEEYIKTEDLVRGEEQEDLMAKRETYQRDGDEEDRFNTTV